MTKDDINGWLSYFIYKGPDAHEIQNAILIATVRNAASAKAKSKPEQFIITKKPKKMIKKGPTEDMMQIGRYQPIKKKDLHKYLK